MLRKWAALTSIAGKIGCTTETLRRWCREEASRRSAPVAQTSDDKARLKLLERGSEGAAPRQRDLAQGVGIFCAGGARPPREMVMGFIEAHHKDLGIEPICRELRGRPIVLARTCRPPC